jgi:hypothetical protein
MMTERRTLRGWFHFNWSSWFSGRSQRAADRRKAADFADYGTAFGLDMSMDPHADRAIRPATQPMPAKAPTSKR